MEHWTNELYHHGIKGQRWGIRRYQNFDGTLTAAGKERYGNDISQVREGKLKRQMLRNGQPENAVGRKKFDQWKARMKEEKKNTDEFLSKAVPGGKAHKDSAKQGEEFIKKVADMRLKNMGYEANAKNIEYLSGKKWFRNSTWVSNTLASIGVKDVDYTTFDDYKAGRKLNI